MHELSEETVPIWIVFTNQRSFSWWHWFTKEDFRHCFILVKAGKGTHLLNFVKMGVQVSYWDYSIQQCLGECHNEGYKISSYNACYKNMDRLYLHLLTCVGLTKAIMGIWEPLIWTPYQLYKWLERENVVN